MALIDKLYNNLTAAVLSDGCSIIDSTRCGVELIQIPHYTLEIPFDEFPILTTKKVLWSKALTELLWMLQGTQSIKFLHDNGTNIWDKDSKNFKATKPSPLLGDVGRVYGVQWRSWSHSIHQPGGKDIDQIESLLEGLKTAPFSRRHIVTCWNPGELHMMALPPCPWAFEIIPYKVIPGSALDVARGEIHFILKWHQRSVDTFLGLPFDIVEFGFLAKIIEQLTGFTCTKLIGDLSNIHIYKPHLSAIQEQSNRSTDLNAPTVSIAKQKNIDDYKRSHFSLLGYDSHPYIKAELFTQTTK